MTALPTTFPAVALKDLDAAGLSFELLHQIGGFTRPEQKMIASAAQVATQLHRGQTRRYRDDMDRVPYIEHPIRVALRLMRWDINDAEVVTAALLHDTLEDCAERIETEFSCEGIDADGWMARAYGRRVHSLVSAVTSEKGPGFSYQDKIVSIADHSVEALLIKASDLVDNAGSLKHQYGHVPEVMIVKLSKKYMEPTRLIAEKLAEAGQGNAATHVQRIHQSLIDLRAVL